MVRRRRRRKYKRNPIKVRKFKSEKEFRKYLEKVIQEWGPERVTWYYDDELKAYVVIIPY